MATETHRKRAGDKPEAALIEPRYKPNPHMLEQVLTLSPTHPEYPWKFSFEAYYAAAGGTPEIYPMKHAIAVALISDRQGRYKKLRFLERKFADSTGFLRNKNAALPAGAQKSPLTLSGLKKMGPG